MHSRALFFKSMPNVPFASVVVCLPFNAVKLSEKHLHFKFLFSDSSLLWRYAPLQGRKGRGGLCFGEGWTEHSFTPSASWDHKN